MPAVRQPGGVRGDEGWRERPALALAKTAQVRIGRSLLKIATIDINSSRNFSNRAMGPSGSYLSTSTNKIAPAKPIANE